METNLQVYIADSYNKKREVLARVKAFLDIEIFKSRPKFLGDPLRITPAIEIEEIKQDLIK
jgi:vancomycin permeability regulator SanA